MPDYQPSTSESQMLLYEEKSNGPSSSPDRGKVLWEKNADAQLYFSYREQLSMLAALPPTSKIDRSDRPQLFVGQYALSNRKAALHEEKCPNGHSSSSYRSVRRNARSRCPFHHRNMSTVWINAAWPALILGWKDSTLWGEMPNGWF